MRCMRVAVCGRLPRSLTCASPDDAGEPEQLGRDVRHVGEAQQQQRLQHCKRPTLHGVLRTRSQSGSWERSAVMAFSPPSLITFLLNSDLKHCREKLYLMFEISFLGK